MSQFFLKIVSSLLSISKLENLSTLTNPAGLQKNFWFYINHLF